MTLKGQDKKAANNKTPKHDSLATKRSYNEISQAEKETTNKKATEVTTQRRRQMYLINVQFLYHPLQKTPIPSTNETRQPNRQLMRAENIGYQGPKRNHCC